MYFFNAKTQRSKDAKVFFGYVVTLCLCFGLLTLIIAAPFAFHSGHPFIATAIYNSFKPICHQIHERSFYLFGYPLAVCARCTGIYLGLLFGVLSYPIFKRISNYDRPPIWILILSAVPMFIDFSLGFLHIIENTHLSRSITGSIFGFAVAYFIIPAWKTSISKSR